MLTAQDIAKQLDVDLETVAYLHAVRSLPEPIRIGGECRWRENDFRKYRKYLLKRAECRAKGIDPDSAKGPAMPVFSTGGKPRFDPRLVAANEAEAERQSKSRTLRAGSEAIAPQPQVTLPEVADRSTKVEGK